MQFESGSRKGGRRRHKKSFQEPPEKAFSRGGTGELRGCIEEPPEKWGELPAKKGAQGQLKIHCSEEIDILLA